MVKKILKKDKYTIPIIIRTQVILDSGIGTSSPIITIGGTDGDIEVKDWEIEDGGSYDIDL